MGAFVTTTLVLPVDFLLIAVSTEVLLGFTYGLVCNFCILSSIFFLMHSVNVYFTKWTYIRQWRTPSDNIWIHFCSCYTGACSTLEVYFGHSPGRAGGPASCSRSKLAHARIGLPLTSVQFISVTEVVTKSVTKSITNFFCEGLWSWNLDTRSLSYGSIDWFPRSLFYRLGLYSKARFTPCTRVQFLSRLARYI